MSDDRMRQLEAAMQDPANQTGSGAWARQATDEELQWHIDGGGPGNKNYEAACRELARRDAARSEAVQLRWIKRTFWMTVFLSVSAIAVTVVVAFL